MAKSELSDVLSRVEPYTARVSSDADIRAAFVDAWSAIERDFAFERPDAAREIRDALLASGLVAAYESVVPCVEALVATELDATTPGERGLGRVSTSPPRLAGAFRKELASADAREAFGPLIEATIREAYAGSAGHIAGVVRPLVKPAEEVFSEWIPRAYVGTRNMSDTGIEMISSCNSATEIRLFEEARSRGLISGIRKKQREQVFTSAASFWIAAGAALFLSASDHPD